MLLLALIGAKASDVKPHPQRPTPPITVDPVKEKKLAEARARAAAWRRRREEATP